MASVTAHNVDRWLALGREIAVDSRWWLENSGGEVKIVILISVSEAEKRIHLEKWEMESFPNQGAKSASPNAPTAAPAKTQEVDIVGDVVTGGPLHLAFEKLMLREPRPGEGDIVFDTKELEQYAAFVWRSTQ
ncbi:hypothetical protein C7212DRAFT_344659 [Tuber magnatum]|uniref:Uncharacterized protein n=1 Tax=Tuber magnatum TaxID=42249 RepID=A0A317SN21_9PEZI|nr:hypothetical protein C7212DRAFT_344659 [Tuber magnatum]